MAGNATREASKSLRQITPKLTPIASDMIIPNLSGIARNQDAVNSLNANYIRRDGDVVRNTSTTNTDFSNIAGNKKVRINSGPSPSIEFYSANLIFDSNSFNRFLSDAHMNFGNADDFQMYFDSNTETMTFSNVPNANGYQKWEMGTYPLTFTNGTLTFGTLMGLSAIEETDGISGTATLSSGSVTVSNARVTANSRILISNISPSGTVGALYIDTITASTSFKISSTNGADNSTVYWLIIEPA